MKKIASIIIVAIMLLLSSCSEAPISINENPTNGSDSFPMIHSIWYDSIKELTEDFLYGIMENEIMEVTMIDRGNDYTKVSTQYTEFAQNRRIENTIHVPYYMDDVIEFENLDGSFNMLINPRDSYGQPCIKYYPKFDETNTYIQVMYLNEMLTNKEIEEANINGAPWLMNEINPHGKGERPYPGYDEYIIEKEIKLQNRTVKTLIGKWDNGDPRIYVHFVFDNMLIFVCGMEYNLTPEWFAGLDFRPIIIDESKEIGKGNREPREIPPEKMKRKELEIEDDFLDDGFDMDVVVE